MSSDDQRIKALLTLKTIAETLNQSNDLDHMLQNVLKKILEVTQLETGWIFLVNDESDYTCAAYHKLPPALSWNNHQPLRCDSCWCLDRYWDGRLNQAVNIIECKRIEDAITYSWGDTQNLTHHATAPLTIRGERFGILNVGSSGKEHFSKEELTLLQSIAFQIGTAVERTQLFKAQKERAINYSKLVDVLTRQLWKINDHRNLSEARQPI